VADEALVLFLNMPERKYADEKRKPFPEETFVWVVTKSQVRWVRSGLGTAALAQEVAALRCGLDATAWYGEGAEKCETALNIPVAGSPGLNQPLPSIMPAPTSCIWRCWVRRGTSSGASTC
jgi:hypothetical protein